MKRCAFIKLRSFLQYISCAAAILMAYAVPAHADKTESTSGSITGTSAFVNAGFLVALSGLLWLILMVWQIRIQMRHRRSRGYGYSWEIAYTPDEVLELEVEEIYGVPAGERRFLRFIQTVTSLSVRRSAAVVVCISMMAAGTHFGYISYRAQRALDAGNLEFASGHFAAAVSEFQNCVQFSPGSIGARIGMAAALRRTNRPVDAIRVYLAALKRDPNNYVCRIGLGDCMMLIQRPEEAEEQYRKAIDTASADTNGYLKLAGCLQRMARQEDAVRVLRQLVRLDPRNSAGRSALGRALLSLGFYEEGIENLEQCVALDPTRPANRRLLADAYVSLKRYGEAADQMRTAIELEPEYADNYYDLGYVLRLCNDPKGAQEAYRLYVSIRTRHYAPFKHVLAGSVIGPEDTLAGGPGIVTMRDRANTNNREEGGILNTALTEAARLRSARNLASAPDH